MELKCKDCKERYVGCHSHCKNYLEWRKEKDNKNILIAKNRSLEQLKTSEKRISNHIRRMKNDL